MPTARLFVGNLPYNVTDNNALTQLFADFGVTAQNPHIVIDRMTGQGKGFAFIEVDESAVEGILNTMQGTRFGGRPIRIDRAAPRPERSAPTRPFEGERKGGGGGHDKRGPRDGRKARDRDDW